MRRIKNTWWRERKKRERKTERVRVIDRVSGGGGEG